MRHWHQCRRWTKRKLDCPFRDQPLHEDEDDDGGGFDWDHWIDKIMVPMRRKKDGPPSGPVMEAAEMVRLAYEELRKVKRTVPLPGPGVFPEPDVEGQKRLVPKPGAPAIPELLPGPGDPAYRPGSELFPTRKGVNVFGMLLQFAMESFVGYRSPYDARRLAGDLEESLAGGVRKFISSPVLKPVAVGAAAGAAGVPFLFNWADRLRKMQGMPTQKEDLRGSGRARQGFETL